jgi:hypothetical protein
MKLTIKTLKQDKFTIEVEDGKTVGWVLNSFIPGGCVCLRRAFLHD